MFEDYFPFPKVGYVSSLDGILTRVEILILEKNMLSQGHGLLVPSRISCCGCRRCTESCGRVRSGPEWRGSWDGNQKTWLKKKVRATVIFVSSQQKPPEKKQAICWIWWYLVYIDGITIEYQHHNTHNNWCLCLMNFRCVWCYFDRIHFSRNLVCGFQPPRVRTSGPGFNRFTNVTMIKHDIVHIYIYA